MRTQTGMILLVLLGFTAALAAEKEDGGRITAAAAVSFEHSPGTIAERGDQLRTAGGEPVRVPAARLQADRSSGVSFQYDALGRVVVIERGDGRQR